MIDIGFDKFLAFDSFFLLFIELFGHESIFRRNGEISHGKMQDLPHDAFAVKVVLISIILILNRVHFYNFADGIVADIFLKMIANFFDNFILIPLFDHKSGKCKIIINF